MAANGMKVIALEEGWKQLKNDAIGKLLEQLDGDFDREMKAPFDHKARTPPAQPCRPRPRRVPRARVAWPLLRRRALLRARRARATFYAPTRALATHSHQS